MVIFIFDMNNDIVSRVLVNKYKILSNIGNIYVNIVGGNIIILIIGTKIMFSKILIIFISKLLYMVIGIDTKNDKNDI